MNLVKLFAKWVIILLVLGLVIWQAVVFIINKSQPRMAVTLKGTTYQAQVADNEASREKGLSGAKSLGKNDVMLFVFPLDGKWKIWMKDMQFPIDIIWLDKDKQVIYLVESAEPSSYPNTTFTPPQSARYVIELQAGTIKAQNMAVGDKAVFDLSNVGQGAN